MSSRSRVGTSTKTKAASAKQSWSVFVATGTAKGMVEKTVVASNEKVASEKAMNAVFGTHSWPSRGVSVMVKKGVNPERTNKIKAFMASGGKVTARA